MTPTNPPFKCNSVMLIDDNSIDNFVNERLIKINFFSKNVLVHSTANSALEYFKNIKKLKNISPALIPDYIFLDTNMPLMDGWDFLREYEKLNLSFDCKIIVLTASVHPEDKEKAIAYKNVVEFASKPLSRTVLNLLEQIEV